MFSENEFSQNAEAYQSAAYAWGRNLWRMSGAVSACVALFAKPAEKILFQIQNSRAHQLADTVAMNAENAMTVFAVGMPYTVSPVDTLLAVGCVAGAVIGTRLMQQDNCHDITIRYLDKKLENAECPSQRTPEQHAMAYVRDGLTAKREADEAQENHRYMLN